MLLSGKLGTFEEGHDVEKRPANAPQLRTKDGLMLHLTPEALARHCTSKDRGSIYDPVLGICRHFCRQKKLCGEEDCKRCGDLDMDQPCLEMEDVRANKEWVCPHCTKASVHIGYIIAHCA